MISLQDVLEALGHDAVVDQEWMAQNIEAAGTPDSATELQEASDTGRSISGRRLLELASSHVQLIDGSLVGQAGGRSSVAIHAVDSSHWDVEGDEFLLKRFQQRFPDAEVLETGSGGN
jgi:hypothetical protein